MRSCSPVHGGFRRVLLLLILVVAAPASATPIKCQRDIARAGAQFVKARASALAKCERGVIKDGTSGACPDAKTTTKFGKATAKLARTIAKACGGIDKTCGSDLQGEDKPASIGWPATCPNIEHGACTNAIVDCGGIATCINCVGSVAVDQAIDLVSDDLALPSSGQVNACQLAVGKATSAFLAVRSQKLQKCWDARLKNKHANDCVPPAIGDGKYLDAIAKAQATQLKAICKACGGPDQKCGQLDDLTPGAIGFPTDCAALTPPEGGTCDGAITNLVSLVACIDCVEKFETSCIDRLQVPSLTPYPDACAVCIAPPPSGPCPASFVFAADGPAVDLDTGWTGIAHDARVPSDSRLTLAISGCAGSMQPTCGECSVSGPLANAGGAQFDNHRCADASWIPCANDGDCVTAGAAGPCSFFFGPPLPLVAGGVATCVVNRLTDPVTGTVNLDDGTSATRVQLASTVYYGGNTLRNPCPTCNGGTCDNGPRNGQACTVQGSGRLGDVSLDCPAAGSSIGVLSIDLNLTTDTQSRTVTSAQPQCRGIGYAGRRCQCDTCNNVGAEVCSENADCPPSGGNPGICGGRRCLLGPNAGAPCKFPSECPGGACNIPELATQPNACIDDTFTTDVDGSACMADANDEGHCPEGPFTGTCSLEEYRSCTVQSDCECVGCLPNQTCDSVPRDCFVDNGMIDDAVHVTGKPDVPCDGLSYPTVGAFFCIPPVAANAVNSTAGLPGLGRIRIPGRVSLIP